MPFEYTDESGNFVGIDVDILAAIAEDQGFEYDLQAIGWDGAVAAVQSGQADAIIAGASITDERKENGWIFSDGYFTAKQTIAVAKDSTITSWEDLKGKNAAVKNGTTGADYADSLKDQYGFTVTKFEDSPTMYQDVLTGNSFACFDDEPVMAANIKQHDLALKIPDGFANEGAPYGLAIMDEKNQSFLTLKDTSILSVIGFPELTNTTKTVVANTMNTQGWAIAGVMYMVVILLLSYLSHRVEGRLSNGR